ncbi:hypothetical protein NDU88_006674 [Pleurodeles waltl]|uniref:Uncharacterized protein n=1 Tax=Pleurodeles waltl TaxID=8319 RepID=A0AAV7MKL7_PLEWA|nr:hypothetical protein NDU88_006674 [Pleurodeles waltl]
MAQEERSAFCTFKRRKSDLPFVLLKRMKSAPPCLLRRSKSTLCVSVREVPHHGGGHEELCRTTRPSGAQAGAAFQRITTAARPKKEEPASRKVLAGMGELPRGEEGKQL